MHNVKYLTPDCDVLSYEADDGRTVVCDKGAPEFDAVISVCNPAPYIPFLPSLEELLAKERASMKCTVRQARIVLGEDVCAALDAMANDAEYPWAFRQTLKYATVWERTLPEIDEIGWALGYTPEEIDDLFRRAMTV